MKLTINGEPRRIGGKVTVAALLKALGADGARVALLVNDAVVPRAKWRSVRLREGDRVELVAMAGGG